MQIVSQTVRKTTHCAHKQQHYYYINYDIAMIYSQVLHFDSLENLCHLISSNLFPLLHLLLHPSNLSLLPIPIGVCKTWSRNTVLKQLHCLISINN